MGTWWWIGNWWQGSVAAPVNGIPLEEQIRELVATKLATILVANGYNQDVTVHRPPISVMELGADDCPALSLRSAKRSPFGHLRKAEEFLLEFEVICAVASDPDDDAVGPRNLAKLMADVRHLIYVNKRWNDGSQNLARRTWIPSDIVHETEVNEKTVSSRVSFVVKARSSQADLTEVKDV